MSFEKDYLQLIELTTPEKDFIIHCMKKISDTINSTQLLDSHVTVEFQGYFSDPYLNRESISKVEELLQSYWFNERDIGIFPVLHIKNDKPLYVVIRIFPLIDGESFLRRVHPAFTEDNPLYEKNVANMFNYCENKIQDHPGSQVITFTDLN